MFQTGFQVTIESLSIGVLAPALFVPPINTVTWPVPHQHAWCAKKCKLACLLIVKYYFSLNTSHPSYESEQSDDGFGKGLRL